MIKVLIYLIFLTLIPCQELVVRYWYGKSLDDGEDKTFKTYYKSEWNDIKDFAVYGWFKIDSSINRNSYGTLFQLTSNDANFENHQVPGDRVLSLFIINNNIQSYTYTTSSTSLLNQTSFTTSDVNKWNFFYSSYSSNQQKTYHYFKLFSSGEKNIISKNIVHYTSNFYRIYIGQSPKNKYFPGTLYNIFIQGGDGVYKENNFQSFLMFNPNNNPATVVPSEISSKLKITQNSQGADIVFTLQC